MCNCSATPHPESALTCCVIGLAYFRKRRGSFAEYPDDEKLTLVGIINCPGCPTLTGADKKSTGYAEDLFGEVDGEACCPVGSECCS